mmetsp:Transcript_3466/g.14282  ORF Transcript_3466/g.14282 Transcript_3466/m.14282 type:complete len:246 (-) Transcript_3466:520-1257(-)
MVRSVSAPGMAALAATASSSSSCTSIGSSPSAVMATSESGSGRRPRLRDSVQREWVVVSTTIACMSWLTVRPAPPSPWSAAAAATKSGDISHGAWARHQLRSPRARSEAGTAGADTPSSHSGSPPSARNCAVMLRRTALARCRDAAITPRYARHVAGRGPSETMTTLRVLARRAAKAGCGQSATTGVKTSPKLAKHCCMSGASGGWRSSVVCIGRADGGGAAREAASAAASSAAAAARRACAAAE